MHRRVIARLKRPKRKRDRRKDSERAWYRPFKIRPPFKPPMQNVLLAALLLTAGTSFGAETDLDKDPRMMQLLKEARTLIDSKKPATAIEKCDKVIAAFKATYDSRKERIYCARSSAESLGYLMKAAVDADGGKATKPGAIALSSIWA